MRQADALNERQARWSEVRLVVADPGDGHFGQMVMDELRRELPYLNVARVGLTPDGRAIRREPGEPGAGVSAAGAAAPPDTQASIAVADIIVAPWTVGGPGSLVARSKAVKLIVPTLVEGMHWVGVSPLPEGPALVETVKKFMPE